MAGVRLVAAWMVYSSGAWPGAKHAHLDEGRKMEAET
jgi:hypothetical protein